MRDLSLHLMDIIQNSISAGAGKIIVQISGDQVSNELEVIITDNGAGMDEELAIRVTDPFTTTRTTRRVGLGVPLLEASAQRTGGRLTINSIKGKGTTLTVTFGMSHIDRPPLGDIAETIINIIASEPQIDIELVLSSGGEPFTFSSAEVKEKLGEVPINEYAILSWIKEFVEDGMKITFGGVLDEVNS